MALALHDAYLARGHEATLAVGFKRTSEPRVMELPRGSASGWALNRRLLDAGAPRAARVARALGDPAVILDVARGREDFRFPGSHTVLDHAAAADVTHLHNLHAGYFDLRLLPSLSARGPTVITLHDEWTFTGHCALTLGCDRWLNACGSCPHLDVYPRLRRDGTAFNLQRKREIWGASRLHIVAPTPWLLQRAQASVLQGAAIEWHVVSNGVDLDTFRPGPRKEARAAVGIPSGALVLVFAAADARASQFKDFPTLEHALGILGATPGPDVVAITIGGTGQTRRLGRVELRHTGFLGRPELVRHFQAADLYVHAARAETQPLSIIEALATGLPAVASAVGGIPEIVREGETGTLVPPGDARMLAAAVQMLLDNEAARGRMSIAAANDARGRFAHADHVDGYLRVYESAISSFAGQAPSSSTLPAC